MTLAATASADFVHIPGNGSIAPVIRPVTAQEAGDLLRGPAPSPGWVHQFFVTTDADILVIDEVRIFTFGNEPLTNMFNSGPPFASNSDPPNPIFVSLWPALGADSWVTTPGITARAGADLPGDGSTAFFDTSNDGPQTNFQFAQITVPEGTLFGFSGRITIASTLSSGTPYTVPFYFPIWPEPSSLTIAGLASLGLVSLARRR
jgi:hypothetical protein